MVRLITVEKLKMTVQLTHRLAGGRHENVMVFVRSFREMRRKKSQQGGRICMYIDFRLSTCSMTQIIEYYYRR
jgi:hypothetical protein